MEEENKNEEVNNEENQNFNGEQQVEKKKKSSTGKRVLIGTIGILAAGIIGGTYYVKKVDFAELMYGVPSEIMEKEIINKQFEAYVTISGETRTEQDIKELISKVESNNEINSDHQITLTYAEGTVISARYRYTVEVKYGNDRYVNEIIIKEAR